ncbi:MFS transporter [Rubrobacter aplysinae]|uniref:MFS transporter n=1 Tax=Rubrobacter aplysinae TaxID=909625 RepID=UPI00069EB0F8|nr:MFS transporter [Rubrobacter aplysinae]
MSQGAWIRVRYRPVLLAVAVATCGVLPAFLTGGLAFQVRGELGFGAAYLGLAVAAFFASSALWSVLSGRVVERIGYHGGMRLAATVSAASLLAVAVLAGSWGALVACLVVGGFGNSLAQPAANLSLAREVPAHRQGLTFGIKQSAIPTATLLAGAAVPTLALTVGWRWAYVGAAALALCVAALVPRDAPATAHAPGAPGERGAKGRGGDVRAAPMAVLALGVGLGSAAATPLGGFLVEASVASGIRAEKAGILLAVGSAAGIGVRVLFGHLADGMRSGRLRLVAAMLGVGTLGFGLLAVGSPASILAGTVISFVAGWGWPGIFNFAVVKTNPQAPAAATGVTQTGASTGAAAGPLLFGVMVALFSYGAAWMTSALLAVAALTAVLIGRQMLLRDREQGAVR